MSLPPLTRAEPRADRLAFAAAAIMALFLLAEPIAAWRTVGGAIILWGIFMSRKGCA